MNSCVWLQRSGQAPPWDSWMKRRKERFPEEQCIFFKQTKALLCDINKTVDLRAAKGGGHLSLLACAPGRGSRADENASAGSEGKHTHPGYFRRKARCCAALISAIPAVVFS